MKNDFRDYLFILETSLYLNYSFKNLDPIKFFPSMLNENIWKSEL